MYAQRVAIAEGGQQRERKLSTFRIGFALIIRLTFARWTGAVSKAMIETRDMCSACLAWEDCMVLQLK